MIALIDIDGTLADNSQRIGFIQSTQKDWDAFYREELVLADRPIVTAQQALPKIMKKHITYFLTGRPERLFEVTRLWLRTNFRIDWSQAYWARLLMRGNEDHRPAVVYKEERIKQLWKEHLDAMLFIDDDDRNTEMYWRYGIFLKAPECWGCIR